MKIYERKMVKVSELVGNKCWWRGCDRTYVGDMPRGWRYLFTYWSRQVQPDFFKISLQDLGRDCVLCPEHVRALDGQLKESGKQLDKVEGNA